MILDNVEILKSLKKYHLDNDLGLEEFRVQKLAEQTSKDVIDKNVSPSMQYFEDGYKLRNKPPSIFKKSAKIFKQSTARNDGFKNKTKNDIDFSHLNTLNVSPEPRDKLNRRKTLLPKLKSCANLNSMSFDEEINSARLK